MNDETMCIMSDADMDAAEREAEARLAEARTRQIDPTLDAQVDEVLRKPYRIEVWGTPEDGYVALVPDLPGCATQGDTPEQAIRNLRDAMASWIEATILAGDPIPAPDEQRQTGRMLLRMPRSLHRRLVAEARRESVSANQLVVTLLAEGLGQKRDHLLADLEHALGIATMPAGPEREMRRFLLQMIRVVLAGERWDLSADAPGSEHTALINACLRFLASLPPEIVEEMRRRLDSLTALVGRQAALPSA